MPLTVYGVAMALAAQPRGRRRDGRGRLGDRQPRPALDRLPVHGASRPSAGRWPRRSASTREVTGERPLGWYTGRISPNTLQLVAEEGGFLYCADSYADDLPYWANVDGRRQLIVPYTLDANDMRFATSAGLQLGRPVLRLPQGQLRRALRGGPARRRRRCCRSACTAGWSAARAVPRRWRASSTMSPGTSRSGSAAASTSPGTGTSTTERREPAPAAARSTARPSSPPTATSSSIRPGSPRRPGTPACPRMPTPPRACTAPCAPPWRRAAPERKLALIQAHPDLAGKLAQAGRLTAESTNEQASAGLDRLTDEERADLHRASTTPTGPASAFPSSSPSRA